MKIEKTDALFGGVVFLILLVATGVLFLITGKFCCVTTDLPVTHIGATYDVYTVESRVQDFTNGSGKYTAHVKVDNTTAIYDVNEYHLTLGANDIVTLNCADDIKITTHMSNVVIYEVK